MTANILTPAIQTESDRYRLLEQHRQAMLAKSDAYRLQQKIERQRREFIRLYGDEFGQD